MSFCRKIAAICVLIIIGCTANAQSPPRYFTDTSCQITAFPMRIIAGQQVVIQCDTAYLVNKYRFKLYEKSRAYILNQDPETQKRTIEEYEKLLNYADKTYQEIFSKYNFVNDRYTKDIEQFQKRLNLASQDLDIAKSELVKAKKDLEDARKQAAKKHNSRIKNGLIWGGTGIISGLIIGFIID